MNPLRRANALPLLLAWLLSLAWPAQAALNIELRPEGSLGRELWLLEDPAVSSLEQAHRAQAEGRFLRSVEDVPRHGIGTPPHWSYLPLENPGTGDVRLTLQLGQPWIDQLDVHLLADGRILSQQFAGDGHPDRVQATPGMGYLLSLDIPPGRSELYLNYATHDALTLPIRLLDEPQLAKARSFDQYSYGLLYGYLLALLAYNLMLFAGLRERRNLDYSLYLGIFILLNMSYTGHAGEWLWSDSTYIKRYSTLVLMVLLAWSGLRFARHFLDLEQHAPRIDNAVRLGSRTAVVLVAFCVLLDWHSLANLIAFVSVLLYTLLMVALGLLCLRQGRAAARYFLAATLCGMLGTACTDLAVWGVLPFTALSYRAVDIGIILEATLLALALAYQMRQHQKARLQAETLARIDPLTGLLNRRAFLEQGSALWSNAERHQRPLAVVMLDLDHFKAINDQYGHAVGDRALESLAGLLRESCRQEDLAARWGGEEFILLLPETTLDEALALAERLRQQLAQRPLENGLRLRASLGVAAHDRQASLEALINQADSGLYQAKQAGRDRVGLAPT